MQSTIRIRGYDKIEQIALGKRAVVFRARDRESSRAVIFKVLLPHLIENPRFLKRFKRDVQLAAGFSHENLVNVLQFGRADDSYFVAYEHYHGKRLDSILSDCPRVSVDVALHIVLGLARALDACHAHRIVHRDVRPGNIVLSTAGGAKLANVALATDIGSSGSIVFAGRVTTTVAYMSPEQTQGDNLSTQSDIFSLGTVAWELLCGRGAFGRGAPDAVAARIQTETPPRAHEVNPLVEPAFGEIVERMLAKGRTERYASTAEVVADIEAAMRAHGRPREGTSMSRYVEDPSAYVRDETRRLIESLQTGPETDPVAMLRRFEKLTFLDPNNENYRNELARLKHITERAQATGVSAVAPAYTDPSALYRVVIESLDTSRETKASFAVKLATKLRVSLDAVRRYVEHMPTALPGEHPHRKAVFLAGILEELGAVVRVEVCRPERVEKRKCPECGTPAEDDAELCGFCQHQFVSYVELRPGLDDPGFESDEQPGAAAGSSLPPMLEHLVNLPTRTKILIGSCVILLIVVLVMSSP